MGSERVWKMRGIRDLKTGLAQARCRSLGTTGELLGSGEGLARVAVRDGEIARLLTKEQQCSERRVASVERCRRKLLATRKRLQTLIERNRMITRYRLGMCAGADSQRATGARDSLNAGRSPVAPNQLREITY